MATTVEPTDEIGEKVTIIDRSQLLYINSEQAQKIKSLRIENQEIDYEFKDFFQLLNCLDSLYFCNCKLDCTTLFDIKYAHQLGFVDCDLTVDSAKNVLSPISHWDYIEILDLSYNKLGLDPEGFFDLFNEEFIGAVTIKTLILSENGFHELCELKILTDFERYDPYWRIIL